MATDSDLISVDLPAPAGWKKKYIPQKVETLESEIVFIAPTGEEMRNRKEVAQYLQSHPGSPSISQFDWGSGESPRRSARISEKRKIISLLPIQPKKKRSKTSRDYKKSAKSENGDKTSTEEKDLPQVSDDLAKQDNAMTDETSENDAVQKDNEIIGSENGDKISTEEDLPQVSDDLAKQDNAMTDETSENDAVQEDNEIIGSENGDKISTEEKDLPHVGDDLAKQENVMTDETSENDAVQEDNEIIGSEDGDKISTEEKDLPHVSDDLAKQDNAMTDETSENDAVQKDNEIIGENSDTLPEGSSVENDAGGAVVKGGGNPNDEDSYKPVEEGLEDAIIDKEQEKKSTGEDEAGGNLAPEENMVMVEEAKELAKECFENFIAEDETRLDEKIEKHEAFPTSENNVISATNLMKAADDEIVDEPSAPSCFLETVKDDNNNVVENGSQEEKNDADLVDAHQSAQAFPSPPPLSC